jgi:hypothetical protein
MARGERREREREIYRPLEIPPKRKGILKIWFFSLPDPLFPEVREVERFFI